MKMEIFWWSQDWRKGAESYYPYIMFNNPNFECNNVRLWERSAEHSKMRTILELMTPAHTSGESCRIYELTQEEIMSVMGWETWPAKNDPRDVAAEFGVEWEQRPDGIVVYPGEGR